MAKYQILTLNHISSQGLHRLPTARYSVGKSAEHPDAILVRSHDMHSMTIPASVKAIGRAGAGTNNIPVAEMSRRGVPVFNAPGANANAVKELVFAALLLAARNVVPALGYVASLKADADDLETSLLEAAHFVRRLEPLEEHVERRIHGFAGGAQVSSGATRSYCVTIRCSRMGDPGSGERSTKRPVSEAKNSSGAPRDCGGTFASARDTTG